MSRRSEPSVAKKSSRLDHALLTGLAKLNLHKTKNSVKPPTPDNISGVPYVDIWNADHADILIANEVAEINSISTRFLDNGRRTEIYRLYDVITRLGNEGNPAFPRSVRTYYAHLLKLFKHAFFEAAGRGDGDRKFKNEWNARFKNGGEDDMAVNHLTRAMGDRNAADQTKEDIFNYFMAVNNNVYNFFLGSEPTRENTVTPKLTNYILSRIDPQEDVYEAGSLLDLMRQDPR